MDDNDLLNKDLDKVPCRFCAQNKDDDLLLNFMDGEKGVQILNLLSYFNMTYIDISQDNLSKMICDVCYNFIIEAFVFFEKVKQAQINLHEINNIKTEISHAELKIEKYEPDQVTDCQECDEPLIYEEKDCSNNTSYEKFNGSVDSDKNIFDDNPQKLYVRRSLRPKKPINLSVKTKCSCKIKKVNIKIEEAKDELDIRLSGDSWGSYLWICRLCKTTYNTMEEHRSHNKEMHGKCYGYYCADCHVKVDFFNMFISHVRDHREVLRYYCQYCNQKFENTSECEKHTKSHEAGKAICDLCGEMFPDTKSLHSHHEQYRKVTRKNIRPKLVINVQNDRVERSWLDYGWTCQVCDKRFPDAVTLREHGQQVHDKCFAMKCTDCSTLSRNFTTFINHVQMHRPYLKKHCAYCNKKINNEKQLATHIKKHFNGAQKPCYGCGHIFMNNDSRKQHMKRYMTPRPAHEIDPEDLVCDICSKRFKSLARLKLHKETHNAHRIRNFTCDICGKAFYNLGTLKGHIALHYEKTLSCKICHKQYRTKSQLKSHVQVHLQLSLKECDYCGKKFESKSKLVFHIRIHTGYRPHKCNVCSKSFTNSYDLRSHLYTHNGYRPYSCKICGKGFTNWGNCNKHMISNHGMMLGKRNLLSRENLGLLDKGTKDWVDALIKNKKDAVI